MNSLILTLMLSATAGTSAVDSIANVQSQLPTVRISVSPVSLLFAGFAAEAEFAVDSNFTLYGAGEYYGLWNGWGAQLGARWYPDVALSGVFVDAHARGSDLMWSHIIGGGLEVGGEWHFGRTNVTGLVSGGLDIGGGSLGFGSPDANPLKWVTIGFTYLPKLRFMVGYTF